MQLDKTYIAIRERDYLEILDLSLRVVQRFLAPLGLALLAGVLPMAIVSHLWANDAAALADDQEWMVQYTLWINILAVLLAPLATAPATLLLGQAMFMERVSPRRIARDFLGSLPQLILFQVGLRGLLMLLIVPAFYPFVFQPYLGEIVLLERNPLSQPRKGRDPATRRITTSMRVKLLHGGSGGELFGRWLGSLVVGGMLFAMILMALVGCTQWINGTADVDRLTYALCVQLAVWSVLGYFTVVRYLSYLDLRIRREGWEVELKMRAEAARLQSELV
jgi:hypothetical protein